MTTVAQRIASAWNYFWFAPIDLYNVGLTRVLLAGTWLFMYVLRFKDFNAFYSDASLVTGSLADKILPPGYTSVLPFYFISESITYWAHLLYLVLLFGLLLGAFGRSLTWLVFVLHLGFMQRNYAVIYGADLFASFWLLYLSLVQHNRHFSIWNLFRRKISSHINLPQIDSDMISTIGVRLLQVQLCISYAYTGIEKLKGNLWWEGVAVWHILGMRELLSADLTFLQSFPVLVGFMTMMTVVFEMYFAPAMLSSKVRPYWLGIGLFFHGFTAIFMNLPFFCMVMISPYLLFIDSKTLRFRMHSLKTKLLRGSI